MNTITEERQATSTDRFGNPLDPVVRYARGRILKSSDEEVVRMLRARRLIGEQVRRSGKESIFDLSGMNRGSAINHGQVRRSPRPSGGSPLMAFLLPGRRRRPPRRTPEP